MKWNLFFPWHQGFGPLNKEYQNLVKRSNQNQNVMTLFNAIDLPLWNLLAHAFSSSCELILTDGEKGSFPLKLSANWTSNVTMTFDSFGKPQDEKLFCQTWPLTAFQRRRGILFGVESQCFELILQPNFHVCQRECRVTFKVSKNKTQVIHRQSLRVIIKFGEKRQVIVHYVQQEPNYSSFFSIASAVEAWHQIWEATESFSKV